MRKLLILANSDSAIFKFRTELIEELSKYFQIGIGIPFGIYMSEIQNKKYEFFDIHINRHGLNPIEDSKLLFRYVKLIKDFQPDVVLQYTIKPNIYGSIACALRGVPCLCNITGLGSAVETPGLLQKMLILMYKVAMKKVHTIFFQNTHGLDFFKQHRLGGDSQYCLLPGSGVNLNRFVPIPYPKDETVRFVFVARIIKEKGIEEYLYAAERFKSEGYNAEFYICGSCEEEYEERLKELNERGVIIYKGLVKDMREIYKMMSCVVLPSYYPEGQSNVLLEGAASCRPLITTDHPGCREAVNDGVSGYLVKKQDAEDLYNKMLRIYQMSCNQREEMGLAGRTKVEQEFDRQIVIQRYIERIKMLKLME